MGGRELWYPSPLRQNNKTPFFKIDTLKNLWYDYGLGQSGNIIDLVVHLCACNVCDALYYLERMRLYSITRYTGYKLNIPNSETASLGHASTVNEKENQGRFSVLELVSKAVFKYSALFKYLIGFGINLKIARKYVSQIDFKAPTLYKGKNRAKLMIFEGFVDFLSYLSIKYLNVPDGDTLVLNLTAFKVYALLYVTNPQYEEIQLFLDNDDVGAAECSGTIGTRVVS